MTFRKNNKMDEQYKQAIIECAKAKLERAGKSLSADELSRGIVSLLKKNYGKEDPRHSSKSRFRSQSFKTVIETAEWRKAIKQNPNKKYLTAAKFDETLDGLELNSIWNWQNETMEIATKHIALVLKKVNDYRFENLVKDVLQKMYPDYDFLVTKRTGDLGRDIVGECPDGHDMDRYKLIIVQAKRYSNSVSRPDADKFIGAVSSYLKEEYKDISKLMPIFVTSGKFSKGFVEKLKESNSPGRTYRYWDGDELAKFMLQYGLGVKYSIDLDFWKEVDSTMFPINEM